MCVLSIKVPIRKKSGNLFNDPRIYIYIYIYIYSLVSLLNGKSTFAGHFMPKPSLQKNNGETTHSWGGD